jgi:hypothetical protein
MFKNASGKLFGIGPDANKAWWVDIKVTGPTVTPGGPTKTPTPTVTPGGPTVTPIANSAFDFATRACEASWFSGAGALPCPGADGDAKGFVLKINNPKLESGATDSRPAILTFPQNVQDGYIQGIYPPFPVKSGDRFRSTINCEFGATKCYAAFQLDYALSGSNTVQKFWGAFVERYEGNFFNVDVDLTPLAGKDVKFILTVRAAGVPTGDRALWVGPYIYRSGSAGGPPPQATGTATVTPTVTPTSTTAVTSYQNTKYNFKFTLPAGASIASQSDNVGQVNLPIVTAGTNLHEKYIQISVEEGKSPCVATGLENPGPTSSESFNGIQFTKQSGQAVGAGNIYDWTAYSTTRNNACIILAFVLHSVNPVVGSPPPPVFDPAKETAVIGTVMNTFNWITP